MSDESSTAADLVAPVADGLLPSLADALAGETVEHLKWYAAALLESRPTRKAELMEAIHGSLSAPATLRRLWERLRPVERQVVAEVVHRLGGRYDREVVEARYPGSRPPTAPSQSYDARAHPAQPFDLLFYRQYELGTYIPRDLAAALRALAPEPTPLRLAGQDEPPDVPASARRRGADQAEGEAPQVMVAATERAAFHDLAATLLLVQQGRVGVGSATRLPTLATVRLVRERLLIGDYLPGEYERAEDAVRPLALVLLVQAAKWAAPAGPTGGKLELTKAGQALLAKPLAAEQVSQALRGWTDSKLLDELSRIRAIRGQSAQGTRLTDPAGRRRKVVAALKACPVGRWVELEEFFRYLQAERLSPTVERGERTTLHLGSSAEYGWLGYAEANYWDIVVGSYVRALLVEYLATLGVVEIAYTRPEESAHDFGDVYGLDELEYLSRYDGLLGFRLTALGAYALGLRAVYVPPAPAAGGQAALRVLPNLDVVVVDDTALAPLERALLEQVASVEGEHVYRLSRERLLEASRRGLTPGQVRAFLAAKSRLNEPGLPQTVRVFLDDVERRLGALRDGGRMLVLEGEDPVLLTELAHDAALRSLVRLARLEDRTVLLVPEGQEAAVRRQLLKLGYVAGKG